MAKKKKKKDTKAARAPKEIAGVKLPKPLREPAAKLLKAVQHPVFADVAAAALIAAAAALRDGKPTTGGSKAKAGTLSAIIATTAIDAVRKAAAEKSGDAVGAPTEARD